MKKIAIVCRENDLFAKLVPQVAEWLVDAGHEISITTFPRSMNESEIKWKLMNQGVEFAGFSILADYTCKNQILDLGLHRKYPIAFVSRKLNELCSQALKIECDMKGVDCPPSEHSTMQEDIDEDGSVAKNLLRRIFNQGNIPEKIYVIAERAGDHEPFGYGWKSKISVGEGDAGKFEFDCDIAAPVIASWFSEIFGQERVEIVSPYKNWATANWENKEIDWEIVQKIDQQNSWVIYDRHLGSYFQGSQVKFHQAKELRIPLSNFFGDVQELGLLDLKAELSAINQQIKKLLFDSLARD